MEAAVVADAPDPADALRRLERIADAAAAHEVDLTPLDADGVAVLALACQRAPYLATLLIRDPARLLRVAADPYLRREKPAEAQARELADRLAGLPPPDAEGDPAPLHAALRHYRADELVRLGARELGLGQPAEVGRELAHLADACLDAAIAYHRAALTARYGPARFQDLEGEVHDAQLVVIGMGKLGGEELNFSSDIDLIFVYSSDAGEAGQLSLHEYFCKLCERVTAALGEVTDQDVVFRVDLRLRPEGRSGAIANSLLSTEHYYEAWGRPWERQAWLKARPCAGDRALGAEVMATLAPFVYPRSISPSVIEEVTGLNRRIKAELDSAGVDSGFDLKNGVGGIREVEFFVQALQLIHAGRRPDLRARATLPALDQLLFAGLITATEQRELATAYRYLRHAEHLLQLDSGRQTQRLPADQLELDRFARRLGHTDRAELRRVLAGHTAAVARLFSTLEAAEAGPPAPALALVAGELDPERERELLAELGFRDPERAQQDLELARRKPLSPFARAASGAAARVAPGLLAELGASPDPDQGLRHVVDLIARRGSWSSLWRLFDQSPMLMRLIVSLFGTSQFLSKTFVRHPELIDALVQTGRARTHRSEAELHAILSGRLAALDPDDEEGHWNVLAEFKQAQILRIGLADIAGQLDYAATSLELSKLAEVTLSTAFTWVSGNLVERHGTPHLQDGAPATLAVLALGKLGARELGYASDLDLIFVHAGDGESDGARALDNVTYMTRLAQRLMSSLHTLHPGGRLYEVDARLRPSGSRGLLVSSLAAWRKYHRGAGAEVRGESARLWERQALIKLRPVAGDPELGAAVAAAAEQFVYGVAPGHDGTETVAELSAAIAAMRDRIAEERGATELAPFAPGSSRGSGPRAGHDVKTGPGGLVDVEFAAQFLQLAHGHRHPELRTPSTTEALAAAAALGVADPGDCSLLHDGYRFLRTLEQRMRIVHDRSEQRLPSGPDLDLLARRVGFAAGDELVAAYRRWTVQIRGAYLRILSPSSS